MGFMDFFKPHWKHSDPAVRAAAIRSLEEDQQEVLLGLALEDSDVANRIAAARRLKDAALLRRLRDRSTDKGIKELAQKQLAERLAADAKAEARGADSVEKARAALLEIGDDQKALEDVARHAASLDIRKAAFAKLVHASAFQAVALQEEDEKLALSALAKVSRESHLEALAKSARSKAVRLAAKERLKGVIASKGPDTASVNRAKLALIFTVGEKAAAAASEPPAAFAWESMNEQVDEAERALRELSSTGTAADAAKSARFRDQIAQFRESYLRHKQELAARQERQRQNGENKKLKQEICEELETLWSSDPEVDPQEIRARRDRFQALGFCEEADEESLQKRFRTIVDKIERERERRVREKDLAARRQAEEQEHGGRLNALADEAEAAARLAQEKPGAAADRLREVRREWNKAFAAAGQFDGKEALRQRVDSAVASANAVMEGARERNLVRMREIVPELEALLENPDMLAAERRFKELHGEWKTLIPHPTGPEADELLRRHQAFLDRFREAQDWLRWSNLRAKTAICEKLEALEGEEDRKSLVGHFRELMAEWKSLGPVPWDSSEALWDRYHTISDKLYEKCREYFAELDVEREGNLKAKEELCARIEALVAAEDIDWREATETVKEAQGAWKAIGAIPKAQSEAVWTRFRDACNAFFDKRDGHHKDNLTRKLELAALAESLQDSTDWKMTGAQIKEAQEKWKSIGPVPKAQSDAVWERFHGACEKFFQARKGYMEKVEQERPQNLARKEELVKVVESVEALPTDAEKFEKIREAQAAWKEIGPVPREVEEALWERFRKPIDAYFEGRKARMEVERSKRGENAKVKEDICIEAESLVQSTEWKATIDKIKSLQERWKAAGQAPRDLDQQLWRRFRAACDAFFDRLKENSAKRDSEREGNYKKKEDLCFLVESLSGRAPATEEEAKARAEWMAQSLPVDVARFRPKDGPANWNENTEKVKAIQREWKKIGPVPKDKSDALWERFHAACDAFFGERRNALGLPPEDPQINLERKLDLIAEAENLAQNPGEGAARHVQALQRDWRRIGPVPRAQSEYIFKRFTDACDAAMGASQEGGPSEQAESEPEPA
jgi:hypothetical protein